VHDVPSAGSFAGGRGPDQAVTEQPVYFIGGTFGGASLGWWPPILVAILAAALTAVGTFAVGRLIENYKRHRDRQALADAVRSEISVIIQLVTELQFEAIYNQLRFALESGISVPGTEHVMAFPTTIYEKCAERVGLLGRHEADGVVRFYNFLAGFRTSVRLALSDDLPAESRIAGIDFALMIIRREVPRAGLLLVQLKAVADEPWDLFSWAGLRSAWRGK